MNGPILSNFFERYRPTRLSQLVGNKRVKQMVTSMVVGHGFPKGLLCYGPWGSGKTTLARLLSRTIICSGRAPDSVEPCEACDPCRWMDRSVLFGEGITAVNSAELSNERIRKVFDDSHYAHGRPIVITLDEFHRCREVLQDRIVTYLEDDLMNFVLIICCKDPAYVEEPLRDRLIPLELVLPTNEEMVSHLAEVCTAEGVAAPDLELLRHVCAGQDNVPRRCLNALEQLLLMGTDLSTNTTQHMRNRT